MMLVGFIPCAIGDKMRKISFLHILRLFLFLSMMCISNLSMADGVPLLRISTENSASHVQTRVVQMFVDRLKDQVHGTLDIEFHHNAELFRDSNVVKAINDGKVEMAVPGTWQLDRFEPSIGVFFLPMFYGREATVNYELRDGKVGQDINAKINASLGLKVIGRWIDLGYAHLYSVNRKIERHEDLAGMHIRIPGGEANGLRIEALGAVPVIVPWPDLPQALSHGTIDGILTTHETVVSAKLWEKGIRYAFEDKEYFPQYVPIISERFWKRLPPETQKIITKTWESIVSEARQMALEAQQDAYQTLQANGVSIVTPTTEELTRWRNKMLSRQPALIKTMNINPALVNVIKSKLE